MSKPLDAITDRPVRVALAGCGRISTNHFAALEALGEEVELTDVCDTDPAALARAVARTNARGYSSLETLLKHTQADLVSLCTPSGLHPDQVIRVAESGRHVLTEKPMATRWAQGLAMVEACDRAQVQLFVVKQNRLNPTIQLLKRALDQRRFGRLYMINVNVFWTRPQSYYDSAAWRGTWEFDGGALMNQASHYVDLLEWLGGPVESVQGYIATLARDIEVEDTASVTLRWRNGALGSINATMLTYPRNLEGSIVLIGEKGTVRIGGNALNRVEHWEFQDPDPMDEEVASASYETGSVYGFGHGAYYRNVVDVLQGRAQPFTNGREGLKSLELLVAAYISARDGRKVSLPLEL